MTITTTRRTMAAMISRLDPFQDHHRGANEGGRMTLARMARRLREYTR